MPPPWLSTRWLNRLVDQKWSSEDAIVERLNIDERRCKGCGLCVEFCPKHCLELGNGMNAIGYHPAELHKPEACTSCSLCAEVCPEAGIRVFRKKKGKP